MKRVEMCSRPLKTVTQTDEPRFLTYWTEGVAVNKCFNATAVIEDYRLQLIIN